MLKKLKKNGIAIFQIPTYKAGYTFVYEEYVKQESGLEMHLLPQYKIFEIAYKNKCIPLEAYPNDVTGQNDGSTMFVLKKIGE